MDQRDLEHEVNKIVSRSILTALGMILLSMTTCYSVETIESRKIEQILSDSCYTYTSTSSQNGLPYVKDYCGE